MEIREEAFIMNSRHTYTHTPTLTEENHRKTANEIPLNVTVCAAANLWFLRCRFLFRRATLLQQQTSKSTRDYTWSMQLNPLKRIMSMAFANEKNMKQMHCNVVELNSTTLHFIHPRIAWFQKKMSHFPLPPFHQWVEQRWTLKRMTCVEFLINIFFCPRIFAIEKNMETLTSQSQARLGSFETFASEKECAKRS